MAPPVIEQLEHWTLVSQDIERTKRFYADVLGAEVLQRDGPAAARLGGLTIDFFPAAADQPPSPGPMGQHHAYRIRLEDYDRWVEHLEAMGVPFFKACHGTRRLSIYVEDPDGYHIELTLGLDGEQGPREIAKRGLRVYTVPYGFQEPA